MNRTSSAKTYWIFSALWTLLIYSTLYIVRPICNFLKKNAPFNEIVSLSLVVLFIFIVGIFFKKTKIKNIATYFLLALVACLYIITFKYIEYPEERIHLVQYGILAFLIYKALSFRLNGIRPYLIAFLLTSLIGWGDELIQGILPNRYYQTTDVMLNSVSGSLSLFLTYIIRRK
ncbi:MAG: VanZ family protein [Candidatus Omnitrophota bacterium]